MSRIGAETSSEDTRQYLPLPEREMIREYFSCGCSYCCCSRSSRCSSSSSGGGGGSGGGSSSGSGSTMVAMVMSPPQRAGRSREQCGAISILKIASGRHFIVCRPNLAAPGYQLLIEIDFILSVGYRYLTCEF